jgi:hypothetical protein
MENKTSYNFFNWLLDLKLNIKMLFRLFFLFLLLYILLTFFIAYVFYRKDFNNIILFFKYGFSAVFHGGINVANYNLQYGIDQGWTLYKTVFIKNLFAWVLLPFIYIIVIFVVRNY